MAYADTLTATVSAVINARLDSAEGNMNGVLVADHSISRNITDGSTSGKASGLFSSTFTAATGGGTTLSLASADPLGTAGDDTSPVVAEGLKLKAILIENLDATNYISFKRGTNGESSMLTGTTDSINIQAGGFFLWHSPAGVSAMTDGADDEFLVTANTATCSVKITYLFG